MHDGALPPWLKGGATVIVAGGHSGAFSVRTGSTTAGTAKGANANQTVTLTAGSHTLTVWYQLACPDVITHDWAMITVRDITGAHTYTVIPHTCTNDGLWHQVTYDLTPLATHKIKVSLINHDDLVSTDVTYTIWDDISIT